jgi:hypothetical protein
MNRRANLRLLSLSSGAASPRPTSLVAGNIDATTPLQLHGLDQIMAAWCEPRKSLATFSCPRAIDATRTPDCRGEVLCAK